MKDFRTRTQKKQPFMYSWFFLLFLLFVTVLFARGAYASFVKRQNADLEKDKYQQHLDELSDKKKELESRIENLKTERGVEEELRKRFDITKEGETMIRIIDKNDE